MTLLTAYRGFTSALAAGQLDRLPEFVDPDAYTENCVGLTGWTVGLDVALANFRYGILAAFRDFAQEVQDVTETPETLVIRARTTAFQAGTFLGLPPAHRLIRWDSVDMVRGGADGRLNWRFLISDWEAIRRQIQGQPAPSDIPARQPSYPRPDS